MRRFEAVCYTGVPVLFGNLPFVFNVSGLWMRGFRRPVLFKHKTTLRVGWTDGFATDGQTLTATGELDYAAWPLTTLADVGVPWNISIGFGKYPLPLFIREGETWSGNGRTFAGPLYVVDSAPVVEISIALVGKDRGTSLTLGEWTEDS